ncbi:MAG: polymer-forming cytoskeletal protein [Bryobacteraceae bacterium]|jgi:cytoskeletal protein CcmA (bactofilin family)
MAWNRDRDERQQPVTEPGRPAQQGASQPAPGGAAVLGRNVTVRGEIFSREDLTIDGDVEGSVEVVDHRLTLGPNSKLKVSEVKAHTLIVFGSLTGKVEVVDKVHIRKDASIIGDIQTAGIVIEDGAYFRGGIDITKKME